jgi:hypothetical protein
VAGTTTGLTHVFGTTTVETGTLGMVTTKLDGTDVGTLIELTITIDGEFGMVTTWLAGRLVTKLAGTTTGLVHTDGTV